MTANGIIASGMGTGKLPRSCLLYTSQAALKHLPEGGRIISTAPASAKRLVTSPARTSPTNA